MHLGVYVAQTEFEHEVLSRRSVDGSASVEDPIIYKLIAWRPQDRDDIAQILATGPDLDTKHVVRWAERWEVSERWSEAVACTDSHIAGPGITTTEARSSALTEANSVSISADSGFGSSHSKRCRGGYLAGQAP
jgi:hypothetical protein